ncbi:hypothetical protein SAMN05216178_3525 [Pseudomonas saponiphila]|uniref:Uncharacterized protein n=1 Tax=Pseudomonas saponiphila TaxID=556534 RepID=A0A1H4PXH7_9PSED|nr:hypothetical protein SAMN05216178_3525 [Pseudomonas saponiphila]
MVLSGGILEQWRRKRELRIVRGQGCLAHGIDAGPAR